MLWRLIKKGWLGFFLFTFILTSVLSIWHIYEARSLVSRLYDLREQESKLMRASTRLSLEESLLTRSSRLRQYATSKLNLSKAKDIRSIENAE